VEDAGGVARHAMEHYVDLRRLRTRRLPGARGSGRALAAARQDWRRPL